ncbi:MAG: dihydrofolate synthase / folylpolyglutamate synthase [Chloroflexota bacterium]|nr:dihydrofolate synthase / folylpolyglutamate synthase [Chloroflexota bacterium]
MLDYDEALRYITSTGRFGIKLGLDRTRALLDAVGAPDRGMRGALVAGTNGKGSTCAFMCGMLQAAGLRVASMPKPHLSSYTERVVVDGQPIGEAEFAAAVSALVPAIEAVTPEHGAPTEFEILTTLALRHARDRGADLLVCEVGMGGRLDATNVTDLGVKVITGIDLDHQQYLGNSIAEIAAEKAGIIRPGDVVVSGPLSADALAVVAGRVAAAGAEQWQAGRDFEVRLAGSGWDGVGLDVEAPDGSPVNAVAGLRTTMLGAHQAANAGLAVVAVQALAARLAMDVTETAIRDGVRRTVWPGRLELFGGSPRVLVDGAHNPAAIAAVVAAVSDLVAPPGEVQVVFGAMSDKDTGAMLSALPTAWPAVFTAVDEARALPAADLLAAARAMGRDGDTQAADIDGAIRESSRRAGPDGLVLVLGSLYLAGEARGALAYRREVAHREA